MVLAMQHLAKALRRTDPKLRVEVYAELGLQLTCHPERNIVAVEVDPARSVGFVRVGGGT